MFEPCRTSCAYSSENLHRSLSLCLSLCLCLSFVCTDIERTRYQDKFDEAFLERLAPELQSIVDWLPPYMQEFGERVLGPETQYWAYAARTTGVDAAGVDGKRKRTVVDAKL
eukprot:COSAG02_NODE_2847_length_7905_cov_3.444017_8_plen_112_part_00